MNSPTDMLDRCNGRDPSQATPEFNLTPNDPLAGRLVALWAALRGHDLGQVTLLVYELINRAKTLPREDAAKLAEAEACAVEIDAWRARQQDALLAEALPGLIETATGQTPVGAEIQRDMRRAALDRFLLAGDCTPDDLVELYGFTPLQVLSFGAGAIAEARNLIAPGAPEGAAA